MKYQSKLFSYLFISYFASLFLFFLMPYSIYSGVTNFNNDSNYNYIISLLSILLIIVTSIGLLISFLSLFIKSFLLKYYAYLFMFILEALDIYAFIAHFIMTNLNNISSTSNEIRITIFIILSIGLTLLYFKLFLSKYIKIKREMDKDKKIDEKSKYLSEMYEDKLKDMNEDELYNYINSLYGDNKISEEEYNYLMKELNKK